MWAEDTKGSNSDESSEEDSSEEESSEEESDDDEDKKKAAAAAEAATREDRKAQKKARKEAALARQKAKNVQVGDLPSSDEDEDEEDDEAGLPANPNHSKASRKMAAKAVAPPKGDDDEDEDSDVDGVTQGVKDLSTLSRREREAIEAQQAKEKYQRLSAQGKTDEAKADLARLKVIREQRAAEAARRQVSQTAALLSPPSCYSRIAFHGSSFTATRIYSTCA